jgi:hypothetical protein
MVLQIVMKVESISYTLLVANDVLLDSFKAAVTFSILEATARSHAGLLTSEHVTLILSPGSVRVQAMILPPENPDNEDLEGENRTSYTDELYESLSNIDEVTALGASIVTRLKLIPNISTVIHGIGNATADQLITITGLKISTAVLLLRTPVPTPAPPPTTVEITTTLPPTTTTTINASRLGADSADTVVMASEVENLDYVETSKSASFFEQIAAVIKKVVVHVVGSGVPQVTQDHIHVRFSHAYDGEGSRFFLEVDIFPPEQEAVDDVHWLLSTRSEQFKTQATQETRGIEGINECCTTGQGQVNVEIQGLTMAKTGKKGRVKTSSATSISPLLLYIIYVAYTILSNDVTLPIETKTLI